MKKINEIRLIELRIKGFKCFDRERIFEFGNLTYIQGDNHVGKSSIADAIAYVFAGTSFYGDKVLDRLVNDQSESKEMFVTVQFTDDNGEIFVLSRARKNDSTSISMNGYAIRQADLNELIGEKDLFLSMFNPLYFVDVMGTEGRNMLQNLLPRVEHDIVMNALDTDTNRLLREEQFLSPETYIKNKRREIRALEEDILYMQGQEDLLYKQKIEAAKVLENLSDEMKVICTRITELEQRSKQGCSKEEINELLTELHFQKEAIIKERPNGDHAKNISSEIFNLQLAIEQLKQTTYESGGDTTIIEADLRHLYLRYEKISGFLNEIGHGFVCPTCFHRVDDQNLEYTKGVLRKELDTCILEGKEKKKELNDLKKENALETEKFEANIQSQIIELSKKVAEKSQALEKELSQNALVQEAYKQSLQAVEKKIRDTEEYNSYGCLGTEEILHLGRLEKDRERLLELIEMQNKIVEQPSLLDQMKECEKQITDSKKLINAVILYMGKRNELTFKELPLRHVKINLFEIVKSTGEIRDCFQFTYQGREYKNLSLSEKIKAGLEICELIKKLSGRMYSTFIDNCESICKVSRSTNQLIVSQVVNGKELSVIPKQDSLKVA